MFHLTGLWLLYLQGGRTDEDDFYPSFVNDLLGDTQPAMVSEEVASHTKKVRSLAICAKCHVPSVI